MGDLILPDLLCDFLQPKFKDLIFLAPEELINRPTLAFSHPIYDLLLLDSLLLDINAHYIEQFISSQAIGCIGNLFTDQLLHFFLA